MILWLVNRLSEVLLCTPQWNNGLKVVPLNAMKSIAMGKASDILCLELIKLWPRNTNSLQRGW